MNANAFLERVVTHEFPSSVALLGAGAVVNDAIDRLRAASPGMSWTYDLTMPADDVVAWLHEVRSHDAPRVLVVRTGLGRLDDGHALALKEFFRRPGPSHLVLTGTTVQDPVKALYTGRNKAMWWVDARFPATATGARDRSRWLADVGHLTTNTATHLWNVTGDIDRAYAAARKAALFPDPLGPGDIAVLAHDFATVSYATALLSMDTGTAARVAPDVSDPLRALSHIAAGMRQAQRVNAALTSDSSASLVALCRATRMSTAVVQRVKPYAGHYGPGEVVRRHALLAKISRRLTVEDHPGGALETLAALW